MTAAPYQLLPDLAPDDLRRLTESIIANGVEVPVVVDENGDIIDGHHRAMIADSLGIEYPKVVRTDLNEDQKIILAAELNRARRQMTDAQITQLGRRIEPSLAREAKRRQGTRNDLGTCVPNGTQVPKQRTSAEVAEKVGASSWRTYERNKKLLQDLESEPDGEQLMEYIDSGDWTLTDARKELKSRQEPVAPKPSAKPLPPPVYEVPAGMPSISAATAMLNLANLPTANVVEAGDYLFDMAKDIDAYLDSLPEIISTMKRVARRARHLRDKPNAQETA